MEVKIHKDRKQVEVWLTRQEKDRPEIRQELQELYRIGKEKRYLVAVFLSGEADLYAQTRDLLCENQKRLAAKQVQMQKAVSFGR